MSSFRMVADEGAVSKEEVVQLTKAFQGQLSISMKLSVGEGLGIKELEKIGLCRISVGPKLQVLTMVAFAREAEKFLW